MRRKWREEWGGAHWQRSWVSYAVGGSATQWEVIVPCPHVEPSGASIRFPSTHRHSQEPSRSLSTASSGGICFTSTPHTSSLCIYVWVWRDRRLSRHGRSLVPTGLVYPFHLLPGQTLKPPPVITACLHPALRSPKGSRLLQDKTQALLWPQRSYQM